MYFNSKTINKLLVKIFVFASYFVDSESTRIYFSSCGSKGFSCILNNGKYKITYQCPTNENDPTLFVWQFRAPSSIESLLIRNCSSLKLSLQCSGENKPINYLAVINVTNLVIIKSTFTHTPQTVVFENIENLEYIPENTFSQIKRRMPVNGCINPTRDFQNLYFERVNIGTVAPKAFNNLKQFGNFSWKQLNVKLLQHLAVEIEFSESNKFSISKSILEICEHLAFKIIGEQVMFAENKFVEIFSGAINGTIETFIFSINTVTNLQPYGISILSEKVQIADNRFEYLRTGALEKISPGLLQNSQRNFGKLKFIYEFSHNSVNFMGAGSLNPDMQAYDNVATELKVHHNGLFCSCENLGWLFSELGYGYNTDLMEVFYETIIQEEYRNFCSDSSCTLPLHLVQGLTENGHCIENKTAEDLCKNEKEEKTSTQKYVSIEYVNNANYYTFKKSIIVTCVLFIFITVN